MIFMISCTTEELSDRDLFVERIVGTWVVDENSYVILDDQDITELFLGFEITIDSDLTYTSNSDQLILEEFPWGTSGSFTLNDELTQFTRDDGLVIILDLSDDELSLDLEFTPDENTHGGRIEGVRGGWKCGFRKR